MNLLTPSLTPEEYRAKIKPKRNKYNIAPKQERTYGGRVFSSKLECSYAQLLDTWKIAGAVSDWLPQVPFVLHAKGGQKIGSYIADFYILWADGRTEYVEVKGFMTPLAKWKLAHCQAEYGVKITLVRRLP